jgi:hypothetical protein
MDRRPKSLNRLASWLAALLLIAASARPAAARGDASLAAPPANGSSPVIVSLGLYISDVSNIDEATETFEIQGYFCSRWFDPRLKIPDSPGSSETRSVDENMI